MSLLPAIEVDEDIAEQAYRDLRTARRKNRVQALDAFDAFYKAYVTAIASAVAVYASASALGDEALTVTQLADVRMQGPAWVGLLVAFAVTIGLRSGGRGGPIAFERADVRHLLMAPVDRRQSIRKPALRGLRYAVFLGMTVGAAAGVITSRRMPQAPLEWVAAGAVFGAGLAAIAYGSAMVAGGHKVKVWLADLVALTLLGWSTADVWFRSETSPLTFLGQSALWPLQFRFLDLLGLLTAFVVAAWGIGVVNRSSIEAAERRSRLVGQLRFAATLQDVRTVMVLQRQLAQENLRQRPWIRLRKRKGSGFAKGRVHRRVFYKRSVQGMLRWPAMRFLRLIFFSAVAGFAGLGAWAGTSPLIVIAGVAMWMAALDLCEGLAQEIDHPDRLRASSRQTGVIYLQLIIVPFILLFLLGVLAFLPALIFGDRDLAVALMPICLWAIGAPLAGATLAVNARPPGSGSFVETPETASLKFVWRVLVPPALGIVGFLPILVAQRSWSIHHDQVQMVQAANQVVLFCIGATAIALAWLRYGDQMRENLAAEQVAAAEQRAEKAKEKARAAKGEKPGKSDENRSKVASESTTPPSAKGDSSRDAAKAKNKATQNKRKKR